jgi:hemerythrin
MTIKWVYKKMTTGLSEIDEQHKEWIRRFNEFDNAVINRKGQDAIQSAISFFAQYTETHFAREEACMTQYHCPAQAANRAAHDEFRAKLSEIKGWVEQEGATMVEVMALEQALEEWLVNHICAIDVQLRDVVASS